MADIVNEQGKEPEVSKEDMEKLESVKKADAAVKSMHDFTSPEVLYNELIVGKRLSSDLGLTFVDVDKVIVKKMNMSVKEILQKFGEPYYRALETMTVKALIEDKERKVISLGAGLPVQEQNEQYIKQLGTVVYLKGSAETLRKRLEGNSNPLLEGENQDEKIKEIEEKLASYEKK